jgi:hypothetical protein
LRSIVVGVADLAALAVGRAQTVGTGSGRPNR